MPRQRKIPKGMIKRGDTYYAAFRRGGRLVRKRLSSDLTAAVTILNDMRARADKSDFDMLDNDCPWSELKAEFLKWARQAVRRPHEYAADLKRFESYTKIGSVRQVTPALLMGYREWRLSQRAWGDSEGVDTDKARTISPRTVNREVATLSNMLNKGVEWRRIGSNPIKDLKPLRHDSPLKDRRALTADEVAQVFEASPAHLQPVWRMFMCTAIRRAELVNMRFDDVDFDRQTVTVRASTAKNHKAREIPLDDQMLAILAELQKAARHRCPIEGLSNEQTAQQAAAFSKDHIFVTRANTPLGSNLLRRFYAICKRAGLDDAHPGGSVDIHSLRVTCATLMLQNGANPKDVQAILGHSTLALTMKVYARATESGKRSAINALPFASTTPPAHIVSVQKVPKRDSSKKVDSQPPAIAGVA